MLNRYKSLCIPLLLLVGLAGCTGNRMSKPADRSGSGILFVNLFMEESDSGHQVSFVNSKWIEGDLKGKDRPVGEEEFQITCEFLDGSKDLLKSVILPHPLRRHVEVYSENSPLERRYVELEEAYFSIRTELPNSVRYLRIISEEKVELSIIEL